jgi:type IV secretion system protein TrbJ
MKQKILAAKNVLIIIVGLITGMLSMPAKAAVPVIDGGNLVQNIITAVEEVAQTYKQIEEYETQLQQYENMLQNTATSPSFIWAQAQETIDGLLAAVDTLSYYKQQLGSIDAYLGKFKNMSDYQQSNCFKPAGCSAADYAAMNENRVLASESQKKSNDAMFKVIDKQQDTLRADAATLQRLQRNAQTADGQMQALSYANQLAGGQTNQLLQIRGLLVAQQSMLATQVQSKTDAEAKHQAAHVTSTESRIDKTNSPKNWLELTH